MGLDMYLSAKRYLSDYTPKEKEVAETIRNMPMFDSVGLRVKEVTCEAMYWRKANAIHGWFVDNVQNGEDNCREYWVPHEKLTQLKELCATVIETKNPKLLQPRGGFFFGSTDIDDWYYEDLQNTVDGLEKLLSNTELQSWSFYYQSSW
jgi:hypothetical protein